MKTVILILVLPVAILSFLPERAWAPPAVIQITGEVSLIGIGDDSTTGEPWAYDKRMNNTGLNSPHNPDPGQDTPGGPWW